VLEGDVMALGLMSAVAGLIIMVGWFGGCLTRFTPLDSQIGFSCMCLALTITAAARIGAEHSATESTLNLWTGVLMSNAVLSIAAPWAPLLLVTL